MNYPESLKILDEIKKANKILVNCHRGPDSDSVGSAMALRDVLLKLGKKVDIVCPSDVPNELHFVFGSEFIKRISFADFDFSKYELFIAIDSSTWGMVSGSEDLNKPDIKIIVIDHHATNLGYGEINIIDSKTTSTAELLYKIFTDWGVQIDQNTATSLLTGILGDTGAFQYQGVGKPTLDIASALIEKGAKKDEIVQNIYRSIDFNEIKFWGRVIESMKFEEDIGLVWSAIPYSVYKEYGEIPVAKEDAANLFFPVVKNSRFGIIMVETKEKYLSISLRARNDFDVSKVAMEIGGGGHKPAAGAKIEGLEFNEAVDKVLAAARKYAKNP